MEGAGALEGDFAERTQMWVLVGFQWVREKLRNELPFGGGFGFVFSNLELGGNDMS